MLSVYADEDALMRALASALRAIAIPYTSVAERGMRGRSDHDQLEYATNHGWTVLTFNVHDYARLHWRWIAQGRHHAGIIAVIDQRAGVGALQRAVQTVADDYRERNLADQLIYLRT